MPPGEAAPPRRFAVLVNPAAARGKALGEAPTVAAELDALGAEHRTLVTRDIDHAVEEAGRAARAGEIVIAVGGDGFVGPVAGAVRDTRGGLAVVAGGRGNDFARALGVPSDPAAAARTAVRGGERMVDVGLVDGRPFLGIAGAGFDSEVQDIANRVSRGGSLVYAYAALRALRAWRHATFEARVDGEAMTVTGYAVAVGNTGLFGGGMRLLPHASIEDGRLDVLLIAAHSKLRYLASIPRVFRGTHLEGNDAAHLAQGEQIELSADREFAVYADGDPIGALPATVTVERRCLRVIVPTGARCAPVAPGDGRAEGPAGAGDPPPDRTSSRR